MDWLRRSLGSRFRSIVVTGIFLSLSLVGAKVFEHAKNEDSLREALEIQKTVLESVSAFQPLELGGLYLDALSTSPADETSLLAPPPEWQKYLPPSSGAAVSKPKLGHWAANVVSPLVPVVALLDVLWNLLGSWSPLHTLIILAALTLGFFVTMLLLDEAGWYARLIFVPLGAVLFGSLAALAIQLGMHFGLVVFGRFVKLGALCCGGNLFGFIAYQLGIKYTEHKTDDAVHDLVERIVPGEKSIQHPPDKAANTEDDRPRTAK